MTSRSVVRLSSVKCPECGKELPIIVFEAKLRREGNSLVVTVPAELAKALELNKGDTLVLAVLSYEKARRVEEVVTHE